MVVINKEYTVNEFNKTKYSFKTWEGLEATFTLSGLGPHKQLNIIIIIYMKSEVLNR